MKQILSVGIDIGTSTTQVIFSQISMENTSGYFTVPKISIVGKESVYKGEIFRTPLRTTTLIDGEAVREIVASEFRKAGFSPKDTDTGAVIITGESARKENSEEVLRYLSDFAGEPVASTAGPDLESVVAGKGSGAGYVLGTIYSTVDTPPGGGSRVLNVPDDLVINCGSLKVNAGGGDVMVNGISLVSHVHGGVSSGGSNTGKPQ